MKIIKQYYSIFDSEDANIQCISLSNQINIDVENECVKPTDVYIKWLNSKGYYSYWLFHNKKIAVKNKTVGEVSRFFELMENETSNRDTLGYDSEKTITCASYVEKKYWAMLQELYSSREVYMYIGCQHQQANFNHFIKVEPTNSPPVLQTKENMAIFTLELSMPIQYSNKAF